MRFHFHISQWSCFHRCGTPSSVSAPLSGWSPCIERSPLSVPGSSAMALLAYLKSLFILQLLMGFVFVVSGLIINFIQLCTCILWPINKQLYRRINCRLSYSLWSREYMIFLHCCCIVVGLGQRCSDTIFSFLILILIPKLPYRSIPAHKKQFLTRLLWLSSVKFCWMQTFC